MADQTPEGLRIHVSITRKRSIERDGHWESEEVTVSESMTLKEGDDGALIRGYLLDEFEGVLMAHLNTHLPLPVANVQQANQEFIEDYQGRSSQLPPPQQQPQSTDSEELQHAPKAADRVPGQWWKVTCTHYALTAPAPDGTQNLEFWNEGRQYAEAYLTSKSPAWPASQIEYMSPGGKRPFDQPVTVTQQVSSKKGGSGTFYVDVIKLTVGKA